MTSLTCTMSPLSSFFSSFQSPVLRVVHAVSRSFCPFFFHSLSWKKVTLAFLLKQQNFFSRNLFVLCALQIFSNGRGLGLIYWADATLMSYWHLVRKTIKHPIGAVAMINPTLTKAMQRTQQPTWSVRGWSRRLRNFLGILTPVFSSSSSSSSDAFGDSNGE